MCRYTSNSCCISPLLQAERNLLVYVSRAGEASRRVANEQALLAGERCRCCCKGAGVAVRAV